MSAPVWAESEARRLFREIIGEEPDDGQTDREWLEAAERAIRRTIAKCALAVCRDGQLIEVPGDIHRARVVVDFLKEARERVRGLGEP